LLDLVYNDLIRNRRRETGREGMTAEQVLRSCVLKQFRGLSYEELAFHLEDSNSFRAFARLEMGQYPSSSTLQENIKPISEESWEAIHICLMRYAQRFGILTLFSPVRFYIYRSPDRVEKGIWDPEADPEPRANSSHTHKHKA
jgi:hypothetical protein